MMQVSCKQIGIKECPFTAMGKDMFETSKALHEHAKTAHSDFLDALSDEDAEKLKDKTIGILAQQQAEQPAEEPKKDQEKPPLSTGQEPPVQPAG